MIRINPTFLASCAEIGSSVLRPATNDLDGLLRFSFFGEQNAVPAIPEIPTLGGVNVRSDGDLIELHTLEGVAAVVANEESLLCRVSC